MEKKPRKSPKIKPHLGRHVFNKKENGRNDTGKPEIEIDLELVEKYSRFHPTDAELAALLGIARQTFAKKKKENPLVEEAIEKGNAIGRASLRGKQYDIAMRGNVAMLIWLGKQKLDQAEKSLFGEDANHPFGVTFINDVPRSPK